MRFYAKALRAALPGAVIVAVKFYLEALADQMLAGYSSTLPAPPGVKEQLRRLLALSAGIDGELISHRLWQFYRLAADCEIPTVHRLTETGWPAVEAAMTTG